MKNTFILSTMLSVSSIVFNQSIAMDNIIDLYDSTQENDKKKESGNNDCFTPSYGCIEFQPIDKRYVWFGGQRDFDIHEKTKKKIGNGLLTKTLSIDPYPERIQCCKDIITNLKEQFPLENSENSTVIQKIFEETLDVLETLKTKEIYPITAKDAEIEKVLTNFNQKLIENGKNLDISPLQLYKQKFPLGFLINRKEFHWMQFISLNCYFQELKGTRYATNLNQIIATAKSTYPLFLFIFHDSVKQDKDDIIIDSLTKESEGSMRSLEKRMRTLLKKIELFLKSENKNSSEEFHEKLYHEKCTMKEQLKSAQIMQRFIEHSYPIIKNFPQQIKSTSDLIVFPVHIIATNTYYVKKEAYIKGFQNLNDSVIQSKNIMNSLTKKYKKEIKDDALIEILDLVDTFLEKSLYLVSHHNEAPIKNYSETMEDLLKIDKKISEKIEVYALSFKQKLCEKEKEIYEHIGFPEKKIKPDPLFSTGEQYSGLSNLAPFVFINKYKMTPEEKMKFLGEWFDTLQKNKTKNVIECFYILKEEYHSQKIFWPMRLIQGKIREVPSIPCNLFFACDEWLKQKKEIEILNSVPYYSQSRMFEEKIENINLYYSQKMPIVVSLLKRDIYDAALQWIKQENLDLDMPDTYGITALQIAVAKRLLPMVKKLIEKGGNVNAFSPRHRTPLYYSYFFMGQNREDFEREILYAPFQFKTIGPILGYEISPIYDAYFLEKWVEYNKKNLKKKDQSLERAKEVTSLLLQEGKAKHSEPYHNDKKFQSFIAEFLNFTTDFHQACEKIDHSEIEKLLSNPKINHQININNKDQCSPLFLFLKQANRLKQSQEVYDKQAILATMKMMIEKGGATLKGEPYTNISVVEDAYPLPVFPQEEKESYMESIWENMDDLIEKIEYWNETGNTPLHRAILSANIEEIQAFTKTDRYVQCLNKKNKSPLFCLLSATAEEKFTAGKMGTFDIALWHLLGKGATLKGSKKAGDRWEIYPLTSYSAARKTWHAYAENVFKNCHKIVSHYSKAQENGDSALHQVCRLLDEEGLKELLKMDGHYTEWTFVRDDFLIKNVDIIDFERLKLAASVLKNDPQKKDKYDIILQECKKVVRQKYGFYHDSLNSLNKEKHTPLMCIFQHFHENKTNDPQKKIKFCSMLSSLFEEGAYLFQYSIDTKKESIPTICNQLWEKKNEIYGGFLSAKKDYEKLMQDYIPKKRLVDDIEQIVPRADKWLKLSLLLPTEKNHQEPKAILYINYEKKYNTTEQSIDSFKRLEFDERSMISKMKKAIDKNVTMKSYVDLDIASSREEVEKFISQKKYWVIIEATKNDIFDLNSKEDNPFKKTQPLSAFVCFHEAKIDQKMKEYIRESMDYFIYSSGGNISCTLVKSTYLFFKNLFKGESIPKIYTQLFILNLQSSTPKKPILSESSIAMIGDEKNTTPQVENVLYKKDN